MEFNKWFTELKNNPLWWMRMQEMYSKKNLNQIANETYTFLLGQDARFKACDWVDFRRCFFNFAKNSKEEIVRPQLQQSEEKKEEPVIEISEDEIKQRLQEWQDSLKNVQMVSGIPRLSAKQIIEEGDWRSVSTVRPRSDVEKAMIMEEHIEKVNAARRKVFTTAFPDAPEVEIQAYIKKFNDI